MISVDTFSYRTPMGVCFCRLVLREEGVIFGRYAQRAETLQKFRVMSKGERGELPIKSSQAYV